ncbi:MAG: histidine kinase [Actinomycetota bacterium]|jgi:signal transduction histidine kinase|nr:histidine kinase [Actinomycetota bacterium]
MTRRLQAGVLALMLGGLAAALLPPAVRGEHLLVTEIAYELGVGVLFVVAGLWGWASRPDSTIGRLLTVAGLAWLAARVLVGASGNSMVFTIGLILVVLPIAILAHLAVAFPSGGMASRFERFVVVCSYGVILAGVPFVDLSGCGECPRNLLAVDRGDGLGRLLYLSVTVATLVAIATFSSVLVAHWLGGTTTARRVLAPVLPTALAYALVSAAQLLAELGAPVGLGREWAWVERVALLAVPVAFLGGLLRSRLARSGVGELVVELGDGAPGAQLRSALARALGDPSVEIASWTSETAGYLDGDGRPVELPADVGPRAVTVIERGGQRVGALVHDLALREEPALLDAVCAAAGLAMENERLHAEILARLAEVRASRSRIVEAADAERRRVERNLHDGAQQRLVTLSMALTMARSHLSGEPRRPDTGVSGADGRMDALLSEAADELGSALRELRELARGIHPAILVEEGLEAAIEALAERSPVAVEVSSAQGNGRLPAPVEAAAYYVVSESLANVAKYARASFVTVDVRLCDKGLRVEVADDGVGGATARPGSGLEGLADRVAALDGRLTVESRFGSGTRVSAEIPCG